MALNTTYAPVREAGNGSKVDFDFDFEVLSASDLSVGKILNSTNVKTDMVLGVDFTVTLNTVTRKGTVHYTVAPTTLQDSWIGRAVPITQPTDIPTNNIFREVQVENALDRQAMISQQLEEKIGRALLLPDTSDLSDLSLPTPEAGRALKWNSTENGFENSTYDPDIVGDYAAAAEASATAAAASASDASDSADAAGASAIAAAASAASINLPTLAGGDASKILQVKTDESGYELKTVSSVIGALLAALYPVGSVYVNASVSTNPATLLGFGTWEAFGAGRVMVGIDAGQTEFDVLGETGGEKTHLLTAAESGLASHVHNIQTYDSDGTPGGYVDSAYSTIAGVATTAANSSAPASSAHNNLQPYIVVYMWKRTA